MVIETRTPETALSYFPSDFSTLVLMSLEAGLRTWIIQINGLNVTYPDKC